MKRYLPLVVLLVVGLLLAACTTAAPPTEPEEPAPTGPQQGGTLIITTGDDFQGPAGSFDGSSTHDGRLMHLFMDQLMEGKSDGTLVPRLAESITSSTSLP